MLHNMISYENKFEINSLDIMIRFMKITESKPSKSEVNFIRFKSWLVEKIKRGITPQEDINLMQGILNYIKSEPGTNERSAAMKYMFELQFLNN